MKYILMCGGNYHMWDLPRQLTKIKGESVVERTIRLLRQNGITDIAISSNHPAFDKIGVPVLHHNNSYNIVGYNNFTGYWVDAFYPTDEPTCYIFGDVFFSPNAIKKIVKTETDDIEFFASAPPFSLEYNKTYAEPFALKVVNTEHLKESIELVKEYDAKKMFKRKPIMWELWQVIKGTELNKIVYNYTPINDYTTDFDYPGEAKKFEKWIDDIYTETTEQEPRYMIHTMPKRLWYVEDYLIPSMLEQGIKREQIIIYNDVNKEGNLKACMHAFQTVDGSVEGMWHLQDDVIISHDFKEKTEQYNRGMVCGFSSRYDKGLPPGKVDLKQMWWSFPCIRIPNRIALECAEWVLKYIIGNMVYKDWWKNGVHDDMLFRKFLQQHYKNIQVLNLAPNIVDHIDYLLGGSVNGIRKEGVRVRSNFWEDEYLVDELSKKLLKEE